MCTPVKDQGSCGSCWTFGGAESVESAWAIENGELYVLSEQQYVDCVNSDLGCTDDAGCNGGWSFDVYDYLTKYNAMLESDYPYTAETGTACKYDATLTTNVHLDDYFC